MFLFFLPCVLNKVDEVSIYRFPCSSSRKTPKDLFGLHYVDCMIGELADISMNNSSKEKINRQAQAFHLIE